MEIKKVTKENLMDLFYPCGPNEISYINAKKFIVNLWREKRLKSGFLGFVAYENDIPVGRVEIWPIEENINLISGKDLYFMPCIWVLPQFQKKGIGRALIEEVFKNTKDRSGVMTISMEGEEWMPLSFFKKFGFEEVEIEGLNPYFKSMIKKYAEIEIPKILKPTFEHVKRDDKVVVEIIRDMMCPFIRVWEEKFKNILKEYGEKIELIEYVPYSKEEILKYGSAKIYFDGEEPFWGPMSSDEIKKILNSYLSKKGLIV
jgi:ribosomal protein S18 acetylase RimI-like enzyme